MPEPKGKTKFSLWLKNETMEMIEETYKFDGSRNRSDFIQKAIKFYIGYITAENYKGYFPEIVTTTIQGMMDSFENRMAMMMFKYAVELSMLMHIVAADTNVDENTLTKLRGKCVRDVKCSQGMIKFDEALKYQRGG